MILGMTEDGGYIEAMTGDPEERFNDLLITCPEIRLNLLERGKLESNPEKRKKAIIQAKKDVRAKKLRRLKARLAELKKI